MRSVGRRLIWIGLVLALGVAGCRVNRPPNNHALTQTLYRAMSGDPNTFNPILVTDAGSGEITGNLFEGLVRTNPKTTLPETGLAERWEFSEGDKVVTFHLRRDVKWSDGVPFTSRDVVFTARLIYDPHIPNIMVQGMMVDGKPFKFEAPDDWTVVVRLPRLFAPLLDSMGFQIVPAHVLESPYAAGKLNHTWNINTPGKALVTLGPYRLERYVPGQQAAFTRYPDYWMRDENGGQLPRLHGQRWLIVPDPNAQYLRFVAGQTDVFSPQPNEVFSLRERARELNITLASTGIDTGSLFFAFNRNPRHYVHNGVTAPQYEWFTDIQFMRALAHAVDKQGMINLCFRGLGVPAISDTSPANKIYYNPNLKDYEYNLDLAAKLLDEAGYKMLRRDVRGDRKGRPLVFNLATNADSNPVRNDMCVIFKQDLQRLGIKVNYRPLEFVTLITKLDSSFDWDCVLIGFTGGIEPNGGADFLRSSGNLHLWNPSQPTPSTPWEAEIDQLLDQGTRVMDPYARAPYYWRIQQILHDELPIIETVRELGYVAYRNTLENYDVTVWGNYHPEWVQFREN
jgi:peptide/nickel transport system substrate-binding protein